MTSSDRPEWMDLMDAAMAKNEDRTARRSMAVNYPNSLYALVLEAARKRDLSMTAYQRRASLSFAQWDLRYDWWDAMEDEPPVGRFTSTQARLNAVGRGFGPWHIVDLSDHEPPETDV